MFDTERHLCGDERAPAFIEPIREEQDAVINISGEKGAKKVSFVPRASVGKDPIAGVFEGEKDVVDVDEDSGGKDREDAE